MEKQKRLDINWYAGVDDTITFDITGDQSQRVLSFVIKADKNDTSNRLVQKTSSLNQISAVYSPATLKTSISINLLKEDTFDLGGKTYYWDLRSDSATDPADTKVPIRGNFNIEAAIQTPFDGTNLPSQAIRYIPIPDTILDGYIPKRNFSNPNYFDSILVYEKSESDAQQAALQQNINTEASARANAVTTESNSRSAADTTLQNNIDAEALARTNADTTESQARSGADSTLQTNIDNETTARTNADSTLQTNINNEATSRSNADITLQNNINTEASARANAVTTESNSRSAADTTLQNNIDAEALARTNADTAELQARSGADSTLQTNIDNETTARTNADSTLQTNIDNESTSRTSADTALANSKVDKIVGKALSTNDLTDILLASFNGAVALEHSHANKSTLDNVTQNNLDSIAQHNALFDYLLNGNLDENNTILNLDENNFIINIGVL